MNAISKIRRQGGAAVVTIPPLLLKALNSEVGSELSLTVRDGKLIAEPQKRRRKRYSLKELLRGSEEMARLTAETSWAREGAPTGRELG